MDEDDESIIDAYCQGTLEQLEEDYRHYYDIWCWEDDNEWIEAIMVQLEKKIKEMKE